MQKDTNLRTVKKEAINTLLLKINDIARECDRHEYGLPMFSEGYMALMREAVNEWIYEQKLKPQ